MALTSRRTQLAGLSGRLEALSPLAVLGRGYAVALKAGEVVTEGSALAAGDELELRLASGGARVQVLSGYSESGSS